MEVSYSMYVPGGSNAIKLSLRRTLVLLNKYEQLRG